MRRLGHRTARDDQGHAPRGRRLRTMLAAVGGLGLLATTLALVVAEPEEARAADGTVTGTVFRDFNADGLLNPTASASLPAVDVGVAGATVRAFDSTGAQVGTATSGANGTYSLAFTNSASTAVRIEFTAPAGYHSGPRGGTGAGIRSGTSVQFKSTTQTANFGIVQEGDFSTADPLIVTPVHRGLIRGTNSTVAADTAGTLYGTAYTTGGDPAIGTAANQLKPLATKGQTGSVWGIATTAGRNVFSAAFFKRHVPVGPRGLGAIYLTNATSASANATLFATIPTPGPGTNPRTDEPNANYDWFHDAAAFASVYKVGLGDIDSTPDGRNLYVVGLGDRQLYRVPVNTPAGGGAPTAGTPVAIPMPLALPGAATGCTTANVRPFGLEISAKGVFASLTCVGPAASNLRGYVYRYDPVAAAWDTSPAFELPLALAAGGRGTVYSTRTADWGPWDDDFADGIFGTSSVADPQPLISDLEFDANGDMTIGVKDRNGDQTGMDAGSTTTTSTQTYESFNGGDVLRACRNAADTAWVLESAGSCGGRTGYRTNNNQGPGGGEFYNDDFETSHLQTALGSAEQVPGFTDILVSEYDPHSNIVRTNGYRKLSNANGSNSGGTIVTGDGRSTCTKCAGTFGKADGIGDVEALLTPAPLELGNRVWLDTDRDGIQDPGEVGIPGTTVRLYEGTSLIASTVTDSAGEYVFNDANVANGVKPETAYRIAMDLPGDRSTGGPLGGLVATTADAGSKDTVDSDGTPGTGGYPGVSFTTGRAGFDDHTYDFGYVQRFDLALRKRLKAGQASTVEPGDTVTFAIEVFNQGAAAATAIVLTDTLPPGTTLEDAAWTAGTGGTATRTIAGPLAAGTSTTVDLTLRVTRPAANVTLTNTAEIRSAADGGGNAATDVDSTPDANPANDVLTDDEVASTPTGTPADEDDHDIATFSLQTPGFDLALRKQLAPGQPSQVHAGDDVTFRLTVFNQGGATAQAIRLTDTLPAGTTLSPTGNTGWTASGSTATYDVPGTLATGASTTVDIRVRIGASATAGTFTNTAEISRAQDRFGGAGNDADSTPDTDPTNDVLVDDVITSSPSGTPADEDDHDIAVVTIPRFDLALRKTTTTTTNAKVGDTVPFTITVFNQGDEAATAITVTDHVPTGLTFVAGSNPQWTNDGNGTVSRTIAGPLAAGTSTAVTLDLVVAANAPTLTNLAEISAARGPGGAVVTDVDSTPDTDPTNDTLVDNVVDNAGGDEDDHDIAVVGAAEFDLALRKTTAATNVAPGQLVPFTITVFNQGDQSATAIRVTDRIPAGMTFAAADNPGWALVGGQPTTTIAGPLAPAANTAVTIQLRVASGATAGTLTNTAEISGAVDADGGVALDSDSSPDTDLTNDPMVDDEIFGQGGDEDDHDVASVTVQRFDLALRKTLAIGQPSTVEPGDDVTFVVEVFNQGQVPATEIELVDTLPAGTTLADADWTAGAGGTATTTVAGPLAAGTSIRVPITLTVTRPAADGTTTNTAEIAAALDGAGNPRTDEDSTPNTDPGDDPMTDDVIDGSGGDEDDHDVATVDLATPDFDLALRKRLATGQPGVVRPGQTATFTITVFNQGDASATGITITDTLPAGTTLADADWTAGPGGTATTTLTGTLAPNSSTTVDLTLTVGAGTAPGTLTNTAEISAADDRFGDPGDDLDSTPDANPANDPLVDDVVTSTPTGDPADEDDHDVAAITVPAFDLALRKTVADDIVAPGDLVPFEITVFNQGDIPAADIVITDTLPAGLTFSAADNTGWALVGGAPTRTIAGPLAPGDEVTATIRLRVATTGLDASSDLVNTAEISAATDELGVTRTDVDSTPDTDATDDVLTDDEIGSTPTGTPADEDDHDVAAVRLFDLALRKTTTSTGDAAVGDVVPFDLTVINQGRVAASRVTLTDFLPTQLELAPTGNTGWTDEGDGTATYELAGPLLPGDSATVTIRLRVTRTAARIDNLAEISAAEGPGGRAVTDVDSTPDTDPDDDPLVDNVVDATPTGTPADEDDHDIATIGAPAFDLALRKETTATFVKPGQLVPFTITVFNQGDLAATGVVVTDAVPAGFTFAAADNPGWALVDGQPTRTLPGTLAAGADTSTTIDLRVATGATDATLVNTAEISAARDGAGATRIDVDSTPDADLAGDPLVDDVIDGTGGDEDDHDVAAVRLAVFDLALRKTTTADVVAPGQTVPFTITVFNQGNVPATDVRIVDTLPAGLTLAATGNTGWRSGPGPGQVRRTLAGPIAPGASTSATLQLVVDAAGPTTRTNTAEVAAASDGSATAPVDVDSTPDADATNDVLTDDEIGSTPTGTPADEDDHDVAGVRLFDLALRKTTTSTGVVRVGDVIPFTITVVNQGSVAASGYTVTDFLPSQLALAPTGNAGWTAGTGTATRVVTANLLPGQSVDLPISLVVTAGAPKIDNLAEISAATGPGGSTVVDRDSTPDTDPDDDTLVDDVIDGTGGDEDDHDIASIGAPELDLALRKTTTADVVAPGQTVPFTITVFNQGNVPATAIRVVDTIPAGLALASTGNTGWTAGPGTGQVQRTIAGPLAPGASTSVTLQLDVTGPTGASRTNTAEIAAALDGTGTARPDADSTPNADPTDDTLVDDVIDGTGGDEDDHDVAAVRAFDLALRKTTTTTGRVQVGDVVPFTITVVNQGQVAASGFTVTDHVPAQLALASTGNTGWTEDGGGTVSRTVGATLLPGASTSVTILLEVVANAPTITNVAEVSAATGPGGTAVTDLDSTPDTDPDDDTVVDDVIDGTGGDEDDHDIATIQAPELDLALRKTTAATNVAPGQLVPFTITVFNQGDLAATDVVVTDHIPAGMTFTGAENPGWSLVAGQPTATIAGPLAAGGETSVTIRLRVAAGATAGTLTNTAEISAADDDRGNPGIDADSTPDADLTNDPVVDDEIFGQGGDEDDHDVASVTVQRFDLALRKTLAVGQPSTVEPGDDVTFVVEVFNQGQVPATAIELIDTLPAGTTLADADWTAGAGGTATTTVAGPLAPNTSIRVPITLTVTRPAVDGPITNTAEVAAALDGDGNPRVDEDSTPDATPGNDTLTDDEVDETPSTGDEDDHDVADVDLATPAFDLALRKRLAAGQDGLVRPGQTATFTITVLNQGGATAQDVLITDTLPVGTTLADADWTAGPGGTATTTLAGPILPGDEATVDLTLTVPLTATPGPLTNTAEITAADDRFGDPGDDVDSTPDADATNDPLVDDVVDGTGGDEDDHDVATLTVPAFDLALRKTVADEVVARGDLVPFTITVFNQGLIPASDIVVTDTLPTGLTFEPAANPDWALVGGEPTTTIAGPLAPGAETAVTLELRVTATSAGDDLVNTAEISAATDDLGVVRPDVDSTPNADAADDALVDDEIDSTPSDDPADEDDHDVARVRLFDLALRKTTTATGNVVVGDTVPFDITVLNQGRVAASGFTISDRLPAELSFSAAANPGWTLTDDLLTYVATTPLAPGAQVTVPLDLGVATYARTITNVAEIAEATGPGGAPVTDVDSTPDTDPDDDPVADDVIDSTPTGDPADEDDHDIAVIGAPELDLALRKTTAATNVAPGQLVPFTITVFNQGEQSATAIEVTDRIPAGTTFAAADNPGWALVGGQPTTTIDGPLDAGDDATVTIRLRVAAGATAGTLTNTAEISAVTDEAGLPGVDSDSFADADLDGDTLVDDEIFGQGGDEDDHDVASVTVQRFDLALRKTLAVGQPSTVEPGDDVTFVVEVFNQGEVAATDIQLVDTLPAGTTLADADWTAGAGGTATTTVAGPLAPNASIRVPITLTVTRPAADGTATNTAEIAAALDGDGNPRTDEDSTPDTDPEDDPLSDDVIDGSAGDEDDHDVATVDLATPDFDLALRKRLATGQPDVVRPGQDATFTISVRNQGGATATAITITDTLPAGTTLADDDWTAGPGGTATTTIAGPLAPGGLATVDLTLTVDADATPGDLTNTAEISAAEDRFGGAGQDVDSTPDADATNDELVDDEIDSTPTGDPADEDDHDVAAITVPAFDLALRKTVADDIVAPGDLVPFEITVFNQGDIPAADVVVTDTLPAGLTFAAADNPGWALVAGTPTTTIDGPIAAGADATVTIELRVAVGADPAADLVNTAEISAATDELGVVRADIDSTPDVNALDDVLADDEIDSTPIGDPADEDDHDVAAVRLFDLALRKTTTSTGDLEVGDTVPFAITVFNQGRVAASAFTVTDFLPTQLAFAAADNPGWTEEADGTLTYEVDDALLPGDSTTIELELTVAATAARIDNLAEISAATGPGGRPVTDADSTPDTDPEDDTLVDNVIDGFQDDEDDHDIATVGAPAFDLALRKETTATTVAPGQLVPFTITVFNQGEQSATDIVVTDSIPAGLTFAAADNPGWALADGKPTTTVAGPLAAGDDTAVTLRLRVAAGATAGTLTNTAEISAAIDRSGDPAVDADSVADTTAGNDPLVDDAIDGRGGDEDDHDVASVTVEPFDLALRKTLATGQDATVEPGDPVTFTVTALNQGQVAATAVTVTDTLPAGTTLNDPDWTSGAAGTATTTLAGPIAPGTSVDVDITVLVTRPATNGIVTNTAEITDARDGDGTPRTDEDSTPDADPTNDEVTDDEVGSTPTGTPADEDDHDVADVELATPAFDLALRKTLAVGQAALVRPGQDATFTITVLNQGDAAATSVQVTDTLPAGTTLADADWADDGDGTASITLPGTLAPGASATVDLTLTVAGTTAPGTLTNTAEISAANDRFGGAGNDVDSTPDADPTDDTLVDDVVDGTGGDEDDHDVATITVPTFDLALRKTTTADIVGPGELVPFTITVFNQGRIPAADVVVTDTVPAGFTFAAAENPGWTLVDGKPTTTIEGPLEPGEEAAVTIELTVVPATGAGAHRNAAEISAATDDLGITRTDVDSTPDTDATDDELVDDEIGSTPTGDPADEDDHDVAAVRVFDLALRKTTGATQAQVGDTVPFTIEVFNQGTVAATDVDVADFVPAELAFDAAANPGWTTVDGRPTTTIAGPLAPGASATVTIQLEVVANADRIANRAEITDAAGPLGEAVTDLDSTPDTDPDDDVLVDNAVDGTGGDEDDHDIAVVGSPAFDLALRKALAAGQAATAWPGDDVDFTITVFNQGEQAATGIVVTDTVPVGMAFDPASNPGWALVDGRPTRTIAGPLAPGDEAEVPITLTIGAAVAPSDLTNTAEISAAVDESGRPALDVDSVGDTDPTGDPVTDDAIDGEDGDEDDHDIATVTVPTFDLALRKALADGQASTAYVGDTVRYAITVFNQGTAPATDVVVTDSLPAGLAFDPTGNDGWTLVAGKPTRTVAGPIAAGSSTTVELALTVTGNGASLVNTAEISQAADGGGTVRPDQDSTPDTDPTDDDLVDDVIDGSGGDEDDHDVAEVSAPVFDLALRKALSADQPSTVYVGTDVSYDLTVTNQGEVTATDVDVVDDLPVGLAFDPARNPGWTEVDGTLTTRIDGPLAPGASARVTLQLRVTSAAGATVDNLAEIAAAHDGAGRTPPDVDSTPDADLGNDELVDDEIDSTPTGDPADEDDHDIATIDTPTWDLALRKGLAPGQAATVTPGSHVRYRITVLNQGDRAAYDVTVADLLPAGLSFAATDNPGWSDDDGRLTTTLAGPIEPGASASVTLDLVVGAQPPARITNTAEIQTAVDEDGTTPPDVDSTPDDDPTNDVTDDDVVDRTPETGDEDDHDIETITTGDVTDDGEDPPPTTSPTTTTAPGDPSSDDEPSDPIVGNLPRTGSDVLRLALVGLALVGAGAALRRLRRTAPTR